MVWGHHASSSSRGSLWISGAFPGTPVQYTGGPIFLLGCLSLPLAVGGSHDMGREGGAGGILGLRSPIQRSELLPKRHWIRNADRVDWLHGSGWPNIFKLKFMPTRPTNGPCEPPTPGGKEELSYKKTDRSKRSAPEIKGLPQDRPEAWWARMYAVAQTSWSCISSF